MIQTDSLLHRIYDATNKGLDIIIYYYPQAHGCDQRGKFFKLRGDEKTASAAMKEIKGVWRVTDFGDDGHALSPIDICMREERLDFKQAVHRLAERYGVSTSYISQSNLPKRETVDAGPDEPEGAFEYELNEKLTEYELNVLGPMVTAEVCHRYSYYSVKWYSTVKNRKKTTVSSTETYPIFMRECGEFRKIYQPLNPDKAFRFFYKGNKPKDYVNGLAELKKAYEKLQKELDAEEEREYDEEKTPDTSKEKKSRKLPEAIICSGERDALNCAGMGYLPLWLNSETATLDERTYKEITNRVERLYNIPDLDDTGLRKGRDLALQYIDIYTIELPAWLPTYKDSRGRPRKDLRDYVELMKHPSDFKELVRMAMPCRFWEKKFSKNEVRYEVNTLYMLNFLKLNGFGKIVDPENDNEIFVHVDGYKVREIRISAMTDFILRWARERRLDHDIQNLIINSTRTNTSTLEKIDPITLDFRYTTAESQTLYFDNTTVRVTADGVETIRNGSNGVYAWQKSICEHDFKLLPPAFTYAYNKESGNYKINIQNTSSHYFRFLINASRMYWKEEFEDRIVDDNKENYRYREEHHWDIMGPRLTEEEQEEQVLHLQNKIFSIGYLLHSYKSHSKAWCVWVLENKITEEEESSGGSGKTFMIRFLNKFKNMETMNGRDKSLTTSSQFFMDRVTDATDIMLIDDAVKYFDFNYFYSMITDNMVVNYKNAKSKEIAFKDSPKIVVTSNFPPPANDGSTARRILNCVFSDYYHKATDDNEYADSMRISDDFGYELHNEMYKWEYWNEDYNFCVNCLQFYLDAVKNNVILDPPMTNVDMRMKIQMIGQTFYDWAYVFFSEGSYHLDTLLLKSNIKNDFDPKNLMTMHKFTKKLRNFCDLAPHIEKLNPPEVKGFREESKRIIKREGGSPAEYIYIKTHGTEINNT